MLNKYLFCRKATGRATQFSKLAQNGFTDFFLTTRMAPQNGLHNSCEPCMAILSSLVILKYFLLNIMLFHMCKVLTSVHNLCTK